MGRMIIKKESFLVREMASRFSMALELWEEKKISDKEFLKKMHKMEALFTFLQWSVMKIGVKEDGQSWNIDSMKSFIKELWEKQ